MEVPAGYEVSGLTQKAYAGREGINYHTFVAWWVQHRRAGLVSSLAALMRFTEVRLPSVAPATRCEVMRPNGIIVRGAEAAAIAALVNALEG